MRHSIFYWLEEFKKPTMKSAKGWKPVGKVLKIIGVALADVGGAISGAVDAIEDNSSFFEICENAVSHGSASSNAARAKKGVN